MKPNFALSLSFDGIKLLHRAAGGWREVGEVDVASDDLAGELAVLRKTAASLEPGGVRSKLLIPASQIKYLTIDTLGLSEAACRKEAEAALHNATPYEVADLAYDISLDGAQTHIAAVARETLAEAEAFAKEHRFHPVSFVAVPGDAPFLGEPFFGPAEGAAALLEDGETVEPDGIAVVIVGAIAPQPSTEEPQDTVEQAPAEAEGEEAPASTAAEPQTPETPAEAATPPAPITPPEETAAAPVEAELPLEVPEQPTAKPVDKKPDAAKAAEAPPVADASAPASAPDQDPTPSEQPEPATENQVKPKVDPAPIAEPAPKQEIHKPGLKINVSTPSAPSTAPRPNAPPKSELSFSSERQPAPKPVVEPDLQAQKTTPDATPIAPQPEAAPQTTAAPLAASAPEPDVSEADVSEPERVRAAPAAAAVVAPLAPTSSSAKKKLTPPEKGSAPTVSGFASRRTPTPPAAKPLGGAARGAIAAPDSSSLTQPAPVADAKKPAKSGFLSRRKPRKGAAAPVPAPTAQVAAAGSEAERMTVFGARSDQVGGKPRFLGLIMTVILLVFLAGVAAWAAVFLDEGIAGLIKNEDGRATASAPENQIDPEIIRMSEQDATDQSETEGAVQVAALDPVLSAEDTAVLDALQDPRPEPQRPVITEQEAAARYAVTGIWPLAPSTPLSQPDTTSEPVYRSGIDGDSTSNDAIALPAAREFETDTLLASVMSPPPFGQSNELDASGLLIPTAGGIIAPGGFTLIAASPPLKPPATYARFANRPAIATPAVISPLLKFRPKNRPLGLAERSERAQLGGVSRIELAAFRPSLRPRSIQDRAQAAEEAEKNAREEAKALEAERAAAAAEAATAAAAAALAVPQTDVAAPPAALQNATKFATAKSIRPDTRPRNFARIVKRAERAAPKETRVAGAATVAPRTVAPKLPSKASVARSATVKNAINLRKVNLIGVYGKPSSRRALVRLSNGRYQKVRVGDRIDGGRVSAISNTELRYKKGGRNVVLKMP